MVPEQRLIPACSGPVIGCFRLISGVWRGIFRRSEKFFSTARGGFGPFRKALLMKRFRAGKHLRFLFSHASAH
jgi:hypothetical protein